MKKIVCLLFILMSVVCTTKSQVMVAPEGKYEVYCTVRGYNSWGFGKVKVKLDMGRTLVGNADFECIYENGKKKKFNSMMEVLDYMSKRGWHLHSTFVVTQSATQNVLNFLMVKYVSDDSQIDEGLELSTKE